MACRYGIDGLIIDPYNELDPSRAPGFKEHEHVNQTMAMLRKFARDHNVSTGKEGLKMACCNTVYPRAKELAGRRAGRVSESSNGSTAVLFLSLKLLGIRSWGLSRHVVYVTSAAACNEHGWQCNPRATRAKYVLAPCVKH